MMTTPAVILRHRDKKKKSTHGAASVGVLRVCGHVVRLVCWYVYKRCVCCCASHFCLAVCIWAHVYVYMYFCILYCFYLYRHFVSVLTYKSVQCTKYFFYTRYLCLSITMAPNNLSQLILFVLNHAYTVIIFVCTCPKCFPIMYFYFPKYKLASWIKRLWLWIFSY